ncbi:MAG: alpha/beta hydrolase, partial [Pseudomonadota bacterium]
MKLRDTTFLMIPGYTNSGPDHWQTRWEAKFPHTTRVEQEDWHKPVLEDWVANVLGALDRVGDGVVVIAHSLGCSTFVQAMQQATDAQKAKIKGAFLVAPPDVENAAIRPKHLQTFGPSPTAPLPFPSRVVASQDDEFCSYERAGDMANAWGAMLVDARESGHLNSKSGHGPW